MRSRLMMMGTKALLIAASLILASCGGGGGGGGSSTSVVPPVVSISGPSSITNSNGQAIGCTGTGSGGSDCIKLTANISDPQNRITEAQWQNLNTIGGPCYPMTRNGNVMSVPLYCSSGGYACSFSYDVTWWDGNRYQYTQPFWDVDVQALPCTSGSSGFVFGGVKLAGATVFVDSNRNMKLDVGETAALTNFNGYFSIENADDDEGLLVAIGGYDADSGQNFPEAMLVFDSGFDGPVIISQLSTIDAFMRDREFLRELLDLDDFDLNAPSEEQSELGLIDAYPLDFTVINIKLASLVSELRETFKTTNERVIFEELARLLTYQTSDSFTLDDHLFVRALVKGIALQTDAIVVYTNQEIVEISDKISAQLATVAG